MPPAFPAIIMLITPKPFAGFPLFVLVFLVTACATQPLPPVNPPTAAAYKKAVEDRLGPIWYERVRLNENSASLGTVVAKFRIPPAGGRVQKIQIVSNTGNQVDELMVQIALRLLRVPPLPPPLLAKLSEPYFFMEETFTIFDKTEERSGGPTR